MECQKPVELNFPEPMPDFNSPNNVGMWKQLFAANMGKRVKVEISLFDGTLRSICGDIYIVGNAYVGLMCGNNICLGDIYSIRFVTFY